MRRDRLPPLWSPAHVSHHMGVTLRGEIFEILKKTFTSTQNNPLTECNLKFLVSDVLGKVGISREVEKFYSLGGPVRLKPSPSIAKFQDKSEWNYELRDISNG